MTRRPTRLGDLAVHLGRSVEGDAEFVVRGVAPLDAAGPEDLVFVRSEGYAAHWARSAAGAAIVPPGVEAGRRPVIRSPSPDLDFARAVAWIVPAEAPAAGVHPSAVVAPDAQVDPSAWVGAQVVIGARARVGARSALQPGVVLYPDVRVGADCTLHAGVVLREGTQLGDRVLLQPGVVLGGDGFGYAFGEQGEPVKIPQVGRVVVEDDVEIGANTTVDRATLGETRIGRGSKIDNLVMIAHNCRLAEHVIVVAQAGLAGGTQVGRRALLMAQMGSAGHLEIGAGAFVGGRAGVTKDVAPGARVWGFPSMEERAWHRSIAALRRLPDALRRLRALERRLGPRGGDESDRGS